jgi:hypothetical protein
MPFNHEHEFVASDILDKTLLRQHLVNEHHLDAVEVAFLETARELGEQHQIHHTSKGRHPSMRGKIIPTSKVHIWEEGIEAGAEEKY